MNKAAKTFLGSHKGAVTEYRKGSMKNIFLWKAGDTYILDHITAGCSHTIKATATSEEMTEFVEANGYKVVALHCNI